MAAFNVLKNFRVPADAAVKHLQPGGVYIQGDVISGLRAAEAGELLALAPAGALEPLDEEAETVATWYANLSGNVTIDSTTDAGKQ